MRSGHGGLAVVHGDPGIGKTRLATQLAELAAHDGAAVAAGAAADLAGPPLAP
jgi:MoxR-like ATPase